MRGTLALTLGMSLGLHVAAFAAVTLPALLHHASPAAPDPPPANAGETFELPAPESAEVPLANASPSPEAYAAPAPPDAVDAPAAPVPDVHAKRAARPSHEARPSAGRAPAAATDGSPGSAGSAALYGAVGDRSATDLSRAFTRDFPQAASGDPLWRTAPLGAAGEATVTFTLDEAGHITDVAVTGASGALAQGIRRTMTLIKARAFTAKARVTRLRLVATVSADTVHDGLHGDVFAIGGSFAEGEGAAFFALNVGRRIDLRVRAQ
ncbi:MAG: hypothetical protein JWP97_5205 [Labilithrix sp.]|nr:hypothetical protein [Labilithrix sp.]